MPIKLTRRNIEIALFWAGLTLTLLGVVMLIVPSLRVISHELVLGAGLAALGLNILLGGDIVAGRAPRTYTARGQVVRGRVEIDAGLADVLLDAGSGDRVATVTFGPRGRPKISVEEGVAAIRLAGTRFPPNITRWQANLAGNVLWDLDAQSTLGNLTLDLSKLRLDRVSARTTLGKLTVVCPVTRGCTELHLKTGLGSVEIIIPEAVGASVTVKQGAFGMVQQKNERLLAPGQRRYVTTDYETATAQVEIHVEAAAGDVTLT